MGGTAGLRRNEKADREATKSAGAAAASSKAEDDAYWDSHGDGAKSKSQAKRDQADAASDVADASRAEARRLAKLEEAEMDGLGQKKKAPAGGKKMTAAQLAAAKEVDAKARLRNKFAKEKETKKEVSEEDYARMVDVENDNRTDKIDAQGIDAAIAAMGALSGADGPGPPGTMNMKAAYAAFEEAEMPGLKEDRPGLKMSQYKEALFKLWKKSPMNPQNYPAAQ